MVKARGTLSLPVDMLRKVAGVYLQVFKRFRFTGAGNIPSSGPVIVVANHSTAYDPVCLQVVCPYRLIRFMQAREYYEKRPLHALFKSLEVIPVNRTGHDITSVRTALHALSEGCCLGIFPEGKISDDGELHAGHRGVALLALISNALVVPAYLRTTCTFRGMVRDFFEFNQVTLSIGRSLQFSDLASRHPSPAAIEAALKRIMDGINDLRRQTMSGSVSAGGTAHG